MGLIGVLKSCGVGWAAAGDALRKGLSGKGLRAVDPLGSIDPGGGVKWAESARVGACR